MELPLPDLDDLTFDDLLAEARTLIPLVDPHWTDHNESDPGMTLVELFAWLSEMLVYRANRVPERHTRAFLRLLNGPDWHSGGDLAEDVHTTLVALRRVERAVTAADYELLARSASTAVARAHCVPSHDLSAGTEAGRTASRPGHVSVLVLPSAGEQPDAALLADVTRDLDLRRQLGTRLHVLGPVYVPVTAEVVVAREHDERDDHVAARVSQALAAYLDPRGGGPDGAGWPFGRSIYVSEVVRVLEGVPGVDHVADLWLESPAPEAAPRHTAAPAIWNEAGELVGLGLAEHHLPWAEPGSSRVVVGSRFVPVRVDVTLRRPADPGATPADLARRTVRSVVRNAAHPLHGGPAGSEERVVTAAELRTSIAEALEAPASGVTVRLRADPLHQVQDESGELIGVRLGAGELAEVEVSAT